LRFLSGLQVEEASAADLVEADDDAFGKTSRRASTVSAR
jgi:hypothetical protein